MQVNKVAESRNVHSIREMIERFSEDCSGVPR